MTSTKRESARCVCLTRCSRRPPGAAKPSACACRAGLLGIIKERALEMAGIPDAFQPRTKNRGVCLGHVVFGRGIWQDAGRRIQKHRGLRPCISHFRFSRRHCTRTSQYPLNAIVAHNYVRCRTKAPPFTMFHCEHRVPMMGHAN